MQSGPDPLDVDRQFFAALVTADVSALDRILSNDSILIDVMRGSDITKSALLAVLDAGQLKFTDIELAETRDRRYGTAAVVTGRTEMKGLFDQNPFTTRSRYTHVYAEQDATPLRFSSSSPPSAG